MNSPENKLVEYILESVTEEEARALDLYLNKLRQEDYRNVARRRYQETRRLTKKVVKGIAKTTLSLYFAYVALQGGRLLMSGPGQERVNRLREEVAIIKNLSDDHLFNSLIGTYIKTKSLIDKGLERHVRHIRFYNERCKATEPEFKRRTEEVYNPLALFRRNQKR